MDQIQQETDTFEIAIKRPFIPKFFKELNYQHMEKIRKSKKRIKTNSPLSSQRLEKFEKIGVPLELKSSKRLIEINRNGNRIIANWKNDQINGEAEIYYHNGVTFKGVYQNGIKIKGHFKFLNGYEYIGHCLGNKFYGEGSLIFPSGKIISGEWNEYKVIGNGKIQYPHGQVYYGEINDFKKQGKGHLFFSDGSKYVGQFRSGAITGKGTYYIDDKVISTGRWLNGELINSQQLSEIKEETIEINSSKDTAVEIEKQINGDSIERTKDEFLTSIIQNFDSDKEIQQDNNVRKVRFKR